MCSEAEQNQIKSELVSTATRYGSSRWATYESCGRKYDLRYHLGVYPKARSGPLVLGSLMHAIFAYTARAVLRGVSVKWRDVLEVAATDPRFLPITAKDKTLDPVEEANRLAHGYFEEYGEFNAGWPNHEIVAVEQLIEIDEAAPYSTRLDLLLRNASGNLVVVDHKTRSSSFDSDRDLLKRKLSTKPQFIGSVWATQRSRSLDYIPELLINGIIKTKSPKYQRVEVELTREQIDNWNANRIAKVQLGYSDTTCNYTSCAPDSGFLCEYFDYCHPEGDSKTELYTMGDLKEDDEIE